MTGARLPSHPAEFIFFIIFMVGLLVIVGFVMTALYELVMWFLPPGAWDAIMLRGPWFVFGFAAGVFVPILLMEEDTDEE